MAKELEIEGRFCSERYRFGLCGIASVMPVNGSQEVCIKHNARRGALTVKGDFEPDELQPGMTYRFMGHFKDYTNKSTKMQERQFVFRSVIPVVAHDEEGIVAYLVSVGRGLGMAQGTAQKAWNEWGSNAVRVIRENPRELLHLNKRISDEDLRAIGAKLVEQQAIESATIEITNLLQGRGFPKSLPRQCIKRWGNRAAEVIAKDPYRLMAFRGCGFKLCDALYLRLGLNPARLRRQALCGWYAIASDNSGDVWFPVEKFFTAVKSGIGATKAKPDRALELAERLGRISPDRFGAVATTRTNGTKGPLSEFGSRVWVAEGRKAATEIRLAKFIVNAMGEDKPQQLTQQQSSKLINLPQFSLWPEVSSLEIDAHQREKLALSTLGRICILGGSPGTGKTYTVAQLVKALLKSGQVSPEDIAIGAPTGKAAVRVTENLNAAGLNVRARTWHSLLGVGERDEESGEFSFQYNANNPWSFKVLVGDEESMKDMSLACAVMSARPRGCHFLLVGDVNQLSPVGSGAPLRDMIEAGVSYGELTEIKRNSGGIVEACAAIRDGKSWSAGDNLHIADCTSTQQQLETVERIIDKCRDTMDPVWDVQVLCAVNLRSPLCRKIVNQRLHDFLNPNPQARDSVFRYGDKLICTKNGYYSLTDPSGADGIEPSMVDDEGKVYVANGELAKVLEVEPNKLICELYNPSREIVVPRGKSQDTGEDGDSDDDKPSTGCNFDLAYGVTCHKLQGSECPVVIILLDEYMGARQICDRSWIYTAISRAKHKCYLVGRKSLADQMCKRNNIGRRKTFLRERVQLLRAEKVLELI